MWHVLVSSALFLVGAVFFVIDDGYRVGLLLLALLGIARLFTSRRMPLDPAFLKAMLAAMLFPLVSAVVVMGHEGWGARSAMFLSVLWVLPVVAAVMGIQPDARHWFLGMGCGAISACLFAIYQRFGLGMERAEGLMNAIKFGNYSLLMGVMSCCGYFWLRQTAGRWLSWVLLAGAVAGLLTSLLSGSRGGWIGLPFVGLGLWVSFSRELNSQVRRWLPMMAVSLVVVVITANLFGVGDRIRLAVSEVRNYDPHQSSSVGERLSMWDLSLKLAAKAPLQGGGDSSFVDALRKAKADGTYHFTGDFNHPHNDVLNSLVKHGLVSALCLLGAYLVPFLWFRRDIHAESLKVRALAVAGIMLPLMFFDFGLTQVTIGSKSGLVCYYGWLVCLMGLHWNARQPAAQPDPDALRARG